jgi:hypothetical protein
MAVIMDMRVYCKDCKWFSQTSIISENCLFETNIEYTDTYKEKIINKVLKKPSEINKNNLCKWFVAKNKKR